MVHTNHGMANKNEGLHPHRTTKGSHVGSGERVVHFTVAIAHQKGVVLCEQYKDKINGDMFSDFIKHTFKKLSVDARFQKAKGFFKMDVLYKTVKKQDKIWIQLDQSNLAPLLVLQILILWKMFFILSKVN